MRNSRPQLDFLEATIPKLQMVLTLESKLSTETRDAIPVEELRSILGLPAKKLLVNVADESNTKKLISQGYTIMDQIRVGMSRTETLTNSELGHAVRQDAYNYL
jgi:hypothetical protein